MILRIHPGNGYKADVIEFFRKDGSSIRINATADSGARFGSDGWDIPDLIGIKTSEFSDEPRTE